MVRLTIILSRYILVILCSLFTFVIYKSVSCKGVLLKQYNVLQKLLMYLIHFIMNAIIYLYSENISIIVFYIGQIIFFVLYDFFMNKLYPEYNKILNNLMIFMLMVSFGINTRLNYTLSKKQFYICIFSGLITIGFPKIMEKSKEIRNYVYIFGVLGIAALAYVYVMGSETLGAKLAIDFGFIRVQPSEFVKVSFVLFLCGILYKSKTIKGVLISGIFAAMHVLLLVLSKDLGTALILCVEIGRAHV